MCSIVERNNIYSLDTENYQKSLKTSLFDQWARETESCPLIASTTSMGFGAEREIGALSTGGGEGYSFKCITQRQGCTTRKVCFFLANPFTPGSAKSKIINWINLKKQTAPQ